jgi:hypothetical protein
VDGFVQFSEYATALLLSPGAFLPIPDEPFGLCRLQINDHQGALEIQDSRALGEAGRQLSFSLFGHFSEGTGGFLLSSAALFSSLKRLA